jgi:3'-phosphoadenosine 5'-phosphosulfate synthase
MTAEEKEEFNKLPCLDIEDLECVHYLQTISEGWAFPLERFMNEQELLESMNMNTVTDKNGEKHILSVPITQHVTAEQKEKLEGQDRIAIRCAAISPDVLAVIEKPVFFENRKEEIATKTFGTRSTLHPKIARIEEQGDWLVSGESMRFTQRVKYNDGLDHYRMTPEEISKIAEERGADAVYAFQVRNPLHNGHCLLLKDTREQLIKRGYKNPLLLLHPLGGWMKDDDVPLDYRMRQHQALLDDGTLVPEHTILSIWPSPMYYSGPNEVLWHASSRVNAGITHFITGRDPAGVKHPEIDDVDLYDHWHGQKLLVSQKELLNGVDVVPFKVAAYNKVNKRMEFFGGPDCAPKEEFDFISGSRMRKMAKAGEEQPDGFMSPAGWKILCEYYQSLQ